MARDAERPEILVPITVDFDVSAYYPDQVSIKVRDRFLWNINGESLTWAVVRVQVDYVERFITPYQFSAIFCEDLGIPLQPYANTMSDLIQGQLDEASNAVEIDIIDAEVTEQNVVFDDGVDEEEEKVWQEADCRIIINVTSALD